MGLIGVRALTLSPTRHALIWLPFLALFIARALSAIGSVRVGTVASAASAVLLVTTYRSAMPAVMADRSNPLREPEIVALADSTHADLIVTFACTDDLELMGSLQRPRFHKGCSDLPQYGKFRPAEGADEPRRILFVNTAAPMRPTDFQALQRSMQVVREHPVLTHPESTYSRTELRRIAAPGSTEWKRGITVGGAGLFVTLYALPDAIPSGARRPSQPAPMLPP